MIRQAAALALALAPLLAACGVYGPPTREPPAPPELRGAAAPEPCEEHGLLHEHEPETPTP